MKFIADKLTGILSSTYLHETCFFQTCKLNLNCVQFALKCLAGNFRTTNKNFNTQLTGNGC